MKPLSIYIHIPFCIKKCNYCDFLSAPADSRVQEEYLHALIQELRAESAKYRDYTVETVYIGGGTPTVVAPKLLCEVLGTVRENFRLMPDAEISMEANPGTVTKESLQLYRQAGINRLSIGLQSDDVGELPLLGRIHCFQDFIETYQNARQTGFHNINVDLMSALPGQKPKAYEETLKKVLSLNPPPEHISAYSLIIEEGTPFFEQYGEERERISRFGEGETNLPSEEEERQMYELTGQLLGKSGYRRYEISNYSLPGYECRHNQVYWQRGDYAGFGLGAASMVDNVRFRNISDLNTYLTETVKEESRQAMSVREQMEEYMFLGLRLIRGVDRQDFQKKFKVSMEEIYGEVLVKNSNEALLTVGDFVALTDKGLHLANYVMAQFLLEE